MVAIGMGRSRRQLIRWELARRIQSVEDELETPDGIIGPLT